MLAYAFFILHALAFLQRKRAAVTKSAPLSLRVTRMLRCKLVVQAPIFITTVTCRTMQTHGRSMPGTLDGAVAWECVFFLEWA